MIIIAALTCVDVEFAADVELVSDSFQAEPREQTIENPV